jgi:hypothetical protein
MTSADRRYLEHVAAGGKVREPVVDRPGFVRDVLPNEAVVTLARVILGMSQLDRLTDQLDTAVKPDTTNSN